MLAGAFGLGLSAPALAGSGTPPGAEALVPSLHRRPAEPRHRRSIDVHHHLVPPAYLAAAGEEATDQLRRWSVQGTLDDMDQAGVATAMLSVPAAGLWPRDIAANRRTARACNLFMASMAADYPGRFGFFATLPLTDIEGSLAEAAHALDVLKADGVGLFTSYRDRWLGDAAFNPVFAELDHRRAVVYAHPTTADCCGRTVPGISPAAIEYGTDTTRAIASWIFGGNARRFPNIAMIFSHAGGTMPFLIERFEQEARAARNAIHFPDGTLPLLRRYFYDTAQSANPVALEALAKVVSPGQILFGADYPYRNSALTMAGLSASGFSQAKLAKIHRDNALRLFPRLALSATIR